TPDRTVGLLAQRLQATHLGGQGFKRRFYAISTCTSVLRGGATCLIFNKMSSVSNSRFARSRHVPVSTAPAAVTLVQRISGSIQSASRSRPSSSPSPSRGATIFLRLFRKSAFPD